MDYKKLKRVLSKSNISMAIIAFVLISLGGLFVLYNFSDGRSSSMGLLIFGGIFIFFGLIVLYRALPSLIRIWTDKYPLLKAIKENRKDYVVWVYNKQINTTAGVNGPTLGSTHNIIFYNIDGESTEIVIGRKLSPESVIDYLAKEFPRCYIGYSDETREAVSNLLGKKV